MTALTAAELLTAYRARTLSPVEVTEAVLARLAEVEPLINAFITVTPEMARAAAKRAERAYASGEAGPLAGVPVSIKDGIAVAGVRLTHGSRLHADHVPGFTSPTAQRALDAGAVLLGKTNTSEYGWKGESGNALVGPTLNPHDLSRTAGGSSGGAAAAVATGMGPLALGTDGAGSVRIPASFCGVVGMKPTHGLIRHSNTLQALVTEGLLARTVTDAALFLDVLVGGDRPPMPAALDEELRGTRIAWSPTLGYGRPQPGIEAAARDAAWLFARLGAEVRTADLSWEDPGPDVELVLAAGNTAILRTAPDAGDADPAKLLDLLDPGLRARVLTGLQMSVADLKEAESRLAAFADEVERFMRGWDLLVTPAVATSPFAPGATSPDALADGSPGRYFNWTPYTYPFNVTGQPAISVPIGRDDDGLPIGLQIVGRLDADALVLRAAAALQRERPFPSAFARPITPRP